MKVRVSVEVSVRVGLRIKRGFGVSVGLTAYERSIREKSGAAATSPHWGEGRYLLYSLYLLQEPYLLIHIY